LILVEPRIDSPEIEIIEGNEVDVSEELLVSHESYTPRETVTLLNKTTLDRSRWIIKENYAIYVFTVPIVNVSAITIGLTFRTFDKTLQINLNEYVTNLENTTIINPHESDDLKLRIPYLLMKRTTTDNWFQQLAIELDFENHDFDDFQVTQFWIQASTFQDLYPVTIDIQRTNGESLFSNPTTVALSEEPYLYFNYSSLGSATYFSPAQVNETLLLIPGYYDISFRWEDYQLYGNVTVTNSSAHIVWRIKCVRIDVEMAQDLSGLVVSFDSGYDHYYYDFLMVYSPSFYLPSEESVTITIRNWASSYSGSWNAGYSSLSLGLNMNVTLRVDPGLISVGGVSITQMRLTIFTVCFLFILSLVLVVVVKRESVVKFLPLLILFISIVLPWIQVSHKETIPYSTPLDVSEEVWMVSPGIFTSYFAYDNYSLAIGPSKSPSTAFFGIEIGSLVLFLFLLLLVGSLHELVSDEHTIRDDQFLFLFGLIILLEFATLTSVLQPWIDSFVIGPGPIVSFIALVVWGILYRRVGGAPLQKPYGVVRDLQ
jgi:hypothetical protein